MSIRSANRISDLLIAATDPFVAPIISLLFPQECGLCGGQVNGFRNGTVCDECWSQSFFFDSTSPLCEKCGAYNSQARSFSSMQCGRCDSYSFDHAIALGPYEKGLRNAILTLKSKPYLPVVVVQQIAERFEGLAVADFDVIVPVPLSKRRRHERSFNQAEVIADAVARLTGLTVDRNSLQREKHTQMHRAGMDQKAREKTVANAFTVARPKMIDGKNVLLTDDVLTSGATASTCSQTLKAYGARSVTVFTIARAEFRRK